MLEVCPGRSPSTSGPYEESVEFGQRGGMHCKSRVRSHGVSCSARTQWGIFLRSHLRVVRVDVFSVEN